ncbi:10276_t:CDS:2, partial [Rhizophagus irregularis]
RTVDDGGKLMPITEDAVVDTINRFRKGIDDEVKEDNKVTGKKLQKGNVSTTEEVEQTKKWKEKRGENSIPTCGEEMEWEAIEEKAYEEFEDGHQSSPSAEWFSVKWIR